MFALVRDRSQSPSLSRAYFANNCVKSPFVDAYVRLCTLPSAAAGLSRTQCGFFLGTMPSRRAGAMRGGRARPLFLGLRGRYASFGNTRSRKMGIFCAIRPDSRILSGARQARVRARAENTTTARFFAGCRRQAYRAVSGGALIGRTARFRAARCRQQGCEIRGETILFCAKNARFYALFGGLCIKIKYSFAKSRQNP